MWSVEKATKNELINYGIQTEQSDVRAHVCVVTGQVWVFKTKEAAAVIKTGKWEQRYVTWPLDGKTVVSARGFLVPPTAICGAICVDAADAIKRAGFQPNDNTSVKGKKAVDVVAELMRNARFPMWLDPKEATSLTLQINGTDILIDTEQRIQVKCDWRGGAKNRGGTGNLFLQVAERNYLGAH